MNRHARAALVSVLLSALVTAGCWEPRTGPRSTSAAAPKLKVKAFGQQTRFWCWAAAGQMIMRYVGGKQREIPQARQAADAAKPTIVTCVDKQCRATQPAPCRRGGYPRFGDYDFNKPIECSGPLTFEHLQKELADRPIAYSYDYDADGAHMLVLTGTGKNSNGLDVLTTIDPKSEENYSTCAAARGSVTYRYYRRNHDRTIYCVQVKGGTKECQPCDPEPSPMRERAYASAEAAATAAIEHFADLLVSLDRKEHLEVGRGVDVATFATDELRRATLGDLEGVELIRPPTNRRIFTVRDRGGWFALVTVEKTMDLPEAWEPVAMFEDTRTGDIQELLAGHDSTSADPWRFLIVPGLNLDLLLTTDGELTSLVSEPLLPIYPMEQLDLLDLAGRILPVMTPNADPT